jgi:hypothetical protein
MGHVDLELLPRHSQSYRDGLVCWYETIEITDEPQD